MSIWWEIWAEPDGALIVERHRQGWRFEPSGKVGRPGLMVPVVKTMPLPAAESPLDVLPEGIDIERLAVV